MLERAVERARASAERRRRRRIDEMAKRLQEELPQGISAGAEAEGVVLSGRGIAHRFALEPALRWLHLK